MNQKKVSFIEFERQILFNIIDKYREIVENKKADTISIFRKKQAWCKITTEYNKHPNVRNRLAKQLKRLWENTKARKKLKSIMAESSTQIFVSENSKMKEDQIEGRKLESSKEGRKRKLESSNDDGETPFIDEEMYDQILSPIISVRLKKLEESTEQQKEIHNLVTQREHLQIKALQEQLSRDTEMHLTLRNHEKELHELKLKHEKELHAQKLRNEQELHQLKLAEYNKIQTASYYKENI